MLLGQLVLRMPNAIAFRVREKGPEWLADAAKLADDAWASLDWNYEVVKETRKPTFDSVDPPLTPLPGRQTRERRRQQTSPTQPSPKPTSVLWIGKTRSDALHADSLVTISLSVHRPSNWIGYSQPERDGQTSKE